MTEDYKSKYFEVLGVLSRINNEHTKAIATIKGLKFDIFRRDKRIASLESAIMTLYKDHPDLGTLAEAREFLKNLE